MSKILLEGIRAKHYPDTAIGNLYISEIKENNPFDLSIIEKLPPAPIDNKKWFCYTLEDTVRPDGIKVANHTAIPSNILLKVGVHYSPHFKRDLLILYNQPDGKTIKKENVVFTYVYFHPLNNNSETEGCVGTGYETTNNTISDSRNAADDLFNKIAPLIKAGKEVYAIFRNNQYSDD